MHSSLTRAEMSFILHSSVYLDSLGEWMRKHIALFSLLRPSERSRIGMLFLLGSLTLLRLMRQWTSCSWRTWRIL